MGDDGGWPRECVKKENLCAKNARRKQSNQFDKKKTSRRGWKIDAWRVQLTVNHLNCEENQEGMSTATIFAILIFANGCLLPTDHEFLSRFMCQTHSAQTAVWSCWCEWLWCHIFPHAELYQFQKKGSKMERTPLTWFNTKQQETGLDEPPYRL